MQSMVGKSKNGERLDNSFVGGQSVLPFVAILPRHWRLLAGLLVFGISCAALRYITTEPQYIAAAIVGPPNVVWNGPFLSSSSVELSLAKSATSKLVAGGSGLTANNLFQQYLRLLKSRRLATVLVERDNIIPVIFAERWDAEQKQWRSERGLNELISGVRTFLGQPVKHGPNVDDVVDFLKHNLTVDTNGTAGGVTLSEVVVERSYPTVYLQFSNPKTAKWLLGTILDEADEMIRGDVRHEVVARLSFIQERHTSIPFADQKDALIAVLAGQTELLLRTAADKRFASTLIDAPYASESPVLPSRPFKYFTSVALLCVVVWVILVFGAVNCPIISRWVGRVEHPLRPTH